MEFGSPVTTVAFWLGALLPLFYLPVFVVGIDSITALTSFLALLTIHVVALVVGHDYPETRSR